MSTNINTNRGYKIQEPVIDYTNTFPSQSRISQISLSSKIKQVTPTSIKPKSAITKIISIKTFITERLRILYTFWKIPVVIKNCFNEFHDHDRKVEPANDDFSRNYLGKLLFGRFLSKQESSSEDDVHTTFDLLSFDTLNKAYSAWYDEKKEIDQAKIAKNRVENELTCFPSCQLGVNNNKISHLQTYFNDESVSSIISNLRLNYYPDEHSHKDEETKSMLSVKSINNNSKDFDRKKHVNACDYSIL